MARYSHLLPIIILLATSCSRFSGGQVSQVDCEKIYTNGLNVIEDSLVNTKEFILEWNYYVKSMPHDVTQDNIIDHWLNRAEGSLEVNESSTVRFIYDTLFLIDMAPALNRPYNLATYDPLNLTSEAFPFYYFPTDSYIHSKDDLLSQQHCEGLMLSSVVGAEGFKIKSIPEEEISLHLNVRMTNQFSNSDFIVFSIYLSPSIVSTFENVIPYFDKNYFVITLYYFRMNKTQLAAVMYSQSIGLLKQSVDSIQLH